MKDEKALVLSRNEWLIKAMFVRLVWALPMLIAGVLLCNPLDGLPTTVYGFVSWLVGAALVIWGAIVYLMTTAKGMNDLYDDEFTDIIDDTE